MKKISITFIFLLIGVLTLIFAPKQIFAQGTHSCHWVTASVGCVPANVNCESNYVVDPNYCSGFSGKECNNAPKRNCILPGSDYKIDFLDLESVSAPKFAGGNIGNIVSELLKYLFPLAGLLVLFYLLLGGFQLMTSAGDPKKMQEAKGKLTNALVGFVIVFIAFWLVQIVGTILGIEAIINIFR